MSRRLVISHLTLRRCIGILGVFLPFILILGSCVFPGGCAPLQDSISDYYSTNARDVFVGTLFAIGLFLFAYRGFDKVDNYIGDLGGFFAIGTALVPTPHPGHFVFAAGLFTVLSIFPFFLFTKSVKNPTPQKKIRNVIYRISGLSIAVCMIVTGLYSKVITGTIFGYPPVLVLETIMLLAFGISWFIKGETLFKDAQ